MPIPPEGFRPGAAKESQSEYDGPFSYAGEYHSFAIGFGAGLTGDTHFMSLVVGAALAEQSNAGDSMNPVAMGEVRKEPWYALGGMVIGYIIYLYANLQSVYSQYIPAVPL